MGNSQALSQCQASEQQKAASINELQDHINACEAVAVGNNLTRNKDYMARGFQHAASSLRETFDVISAFDNVNRPTLGTWCPIAANTLGMCIAQEPQVFVVAMKEPRVFGYEHGRVAIACISCCPTNRETVWTTACFLVADHIDKSVRLVQGYPTNSPGAAWSLMYTPNPSSDVTACRFLSDCAFSSSTSSFVDDIPKFMLAFDIPSRRFVVIPTINAWEPQLTNTLSDWVMRPLEKHPTASRPQPPPVVTAAPVVTPPPPPPVITAPPPPPPVVTAALPPPPPPPTTFRYGIGSENAFYKMQANDHGCWRNPVSAPIMDADVTQSIGWYRSIAMAAKAGRLLVGVQNRFHW